MNEDPRSRQQAFEFVRIVWKRGTLVGAIVVLGIVVAYALSSRQANEYSSTAQLEFRTPEFSQALFGGAGLFQASPDPQRDMQTNLNVVKSRSVALEARSGLATRRSIDDLLSAISVEPSSDSNVADITARSDSPDDAQAIAQAFAEGYIRFRRDTDRRTLSQAIDAVRRELKTATGTDRAPLSESLSKLTQLETLETGGGQVIGRAQLNPTPVSPKPKRDMALGAALALFLGCGLAVVLELLDKRVRTIEDFEDAYPRYPLIASIPANAEVDPLAQHTHGPTAEAYRMMREGLRFLDPAGQAQCFLIVSAVESEGKSTVAVNLASSLAAVGQRVILVEADLRRPTAAALFRVSRAPGLSDLLVSDDDIRGYLVDVLDEGDLRVLSSGTRPPNPSDLLRGRRMPEMLSAARQLADVVIIDAPPLLPVSDSRVLLQLDQIDGVILVGRAGVTRRDQAHETERVLEQSGRRVFGLVMTGDVSPPSSSYYEEPTDPSPRRRIKFRV